MAKEFIKKEKMVGWYDPGQLADTGKKTVISTIIGEYADPRAGAADPTHGKFFDYSTQIRLTTEAEKKADDDEKKLHDDFRNIEGTSRDGIWIDYVADVGDGWNSTYAVAYNLAMQNLPAKLKIEPEDPKKKTDPPEYEDFGETPRGELLVFGGDGVYPTASTTEYETRLVSPYEIAFRSGSAEGAEGENTGSQAVDLKKNPQVFSLPGNHDWYDSLIAFKKIFCSEVFNRRMFGGWRTRQRRSYFALKLPQDWWLLGVDLQLAHSIDLGQLEYLSSVADEMNEKSKVILCVPEPYWIKAVKYDKYNLDTVEQKERSIQKLEEFLEKRGARVKAYIAGDLHHYRRLDNVHGDQKITAGGGGAFLHPTHDFEFWTPETVGKGLEELKENSRKAVEKETDEATKEELKKNADRYAGYTVENHPYFLLEKSYPEQSVSKNLDWKNLCFILNNWKFGIVMFFLYPIVAYLLHGDIPARNIKPEWISFTGLFDPSFLKTAWWTTADGFIDNPLLLMVVLILIAALIFFTDSNAPLYKCVAGGLHGIAHLTAIFFLGWASFLISVCINGIYYLNDTGAGQCIKTGIFGKCIANETYRNIAWFVSVLTVPAIGGFIIGSFIMGIYLFISLHIFGRHDNEAFSALKIEDYKNFLRMHIDKNGAMTVYPYKIEKVSKEWKEEKRGGQIFASPGDNLSKAELIEKPVKIG